MGSPSPKPAWIGITLGDVAGIGPEVTLKALATPGLRHPGTRFLVLGDAACLERMNQRLGLSLPLCPFRGFDVAEGLYVLDPRPTALAAEVAPRSELAARAALDWLREGARLCLRGELAALVTAPVCKESIIRSGERFVGQTEFLSALAGTDRPIMMLLGSDDRGRWLRVALVTTHVPLGRVAGEITPAKVELAVARAAQACHDLGLPRARVAVCGLNPHAGEGGALGTEEITAIRPAVLAAQARGFDATGPLAADTVFHQAYRGDYEAVVAMYHDQGLAPLKLIAFETGVNWTLGLPFIRTSPDHGTAYDLAGQGRASAGSMVSAIRLARQLAGRG